MRQLLPHPPDEAVTVDEVNVADGVDPLDVYLAADRTPPAGRPWVMVNMIASADGAVAVDGASRGLGSPADKAVFRAVRACADWILVGAATVRAERYGLPRLRAAALDARRAAGRSEQPGLAVVSASLDLDPDLPMLADRRPGEPRPLILTGPDAPADRAERLVETAEVVRLEPTSDSPPNRAERLAGAAAQTESPAPSEAADRTKTPAADRIGPSAAALSKLASRTETLAAGRLGSPAAALGELGRRGAQVVLSEGGPTLNAWLADAGVIDELCLSFAPVLAGGPSPRLLHGASAAPTALELVHLLEEDGMLFARYLALR